MVFNDGLQLKFRQFLPDGCKPARVTHLIGLPTRMISLIIDQHNAGIVCVWLAKYFDGRIDF